jgi:cation diffusion facilitator CzcD-associated flavoprotein CzcO
MSKNHFDVLIIGAGISGISAAYYLKKECPNKSFAILEGRTNLGGTWDFFKYPGIRSDSDMFTFGFKFHPWKNPQAVAKAADILDYLNEVVDTYAIRPHIQFNQWLLEAKWSSKDKLWTLLTKTGKEGATRQFTCKFLSMCSGYYNYDHGYTPNFVDTDKFQGQIVHPQDWKEGIEYENKQVTVIGSGATAITLVPELAKKASKVVMLQRSPTYIVALPDKDPIANFLNKKLPTKLAYKLTRWKNIIIGQILYKLNRTFPKRMKERLVNGVRAHLGATYDVEKHFTPHYNPWDQRVCLDSNGALFKGIKSKQVEVITDHIEKFTPKGILLKSKNEIQSDLVIMATGLDLKLLGGVQFFVDNNKINFSETVAYKGVMFSNIPNLALASGYTNLSWTLKCDLTNRYVCRLLNYMDKHQYQVSMPVLDKDIATEDFLPLTSGYILRFADHLPKAGTKLPWKLKQNFFLDSWTLRLGKVNDGVMKFS